MLTWAFSLNTYALPMKVDATRSIVTSSVCQVIALWKKYLSNTSSTITKIDKSNAKTANAPQAFATKSQNFRYLFFIKKPLLNKN